ncbi:MAG TPA: histone deacetylase [Phycisphaerae bacterium]
MNERACIVYSQQYQIDLAGLQRLHPFDINKYAKIYLALVTDGLLQPQDVFVPEEIGREDLLRVHTPEYLERLKQPALLARYLEFGPAKIAPSGFTDAAVLRPFRYATGGTLLAARLALRYGVGINLGGGYHHAEPDRGGGFCIYADMPIAIRALQAEGLIQRALVVDVDVHQGNGTALCVAADDAVFTFDIHEGDIYPIPKQHNDLDVPLPAGTGDQVYLEVLQRYLPDVFERVSPDIVFLQAGVDSLAGDPLAHFRLTPDGIVERDRTVFAEAARRGVPIVMVLGGGYSRDAWLAQYRSIRSIIETYGLERGTLARAPRHATAKEKFYTR